MFPCRHGATAWLGVAITSMAFMGIYAFLMVVARAPGFNLLFSDQEFFKTALVTHVVLAVVIWFLGFIIFMMYYVTAGTETKTVELLAAAGALLGVGLIVATPFTGPASPLLNNYVPVLARPLYFAGISVFFGFAALGVILRAPVLLKATFGGGQLAWAKGLSLLAAGAALIVAIICFAIAWTQVSGNPEIAMSRMFFESLFWGGGHVLQFANTLGLMAAWAILAKKIAGNEIVPNKMAAAILALMLVLVLAAPFYYLSSGALTVESRRFYLLLKAWGLSFGPIIFGLAAVKMLYSSGGEGYVRRGLALSVFLFAVGGLIALTIEGSDTRIPAHYHGTIGSVTLAFMTTGLVAMVENGRLNVAGKWLTRQLTVYGVGQSLFSLGMYIGGYHGLPRKTFGQAQQLDDLAKQIGMGIMGIGGFFAIISGVVYVIFMIKALSKRKPAAA
ncbi:MAG: cbb3-type cytochrome c oxidase subunit I [Nitrospinae bacterium]|nr:cbb3-type cytochrome c oxidase subunit I [Nitrospinota bacterium]